MPIARLENALVQLGGKTVLGPLSLTVETGDFWGVVGPNGSGKTTLLRVLAGLQAAARGRVVFLERAVENGANYTRALLRRSIGFLFQHHEFLPDLPFTVEDVVYFGRAGVCGLGRRYGAADREAVREALESLGLEAFRKRLYRELSGGERQKTQLARLVAQGADLLLLDEPAAGLDLDWQERLTHLVEDLYLRRRKTLVVVTHDVDHLPASCNRVLLLKQGKPLAAGAPAEVFRPDILSELYGCPMEVAQRNGRFHAFSLECGRHKRDGGQ